MNTGLRAFTAAPSLASLLLAGGIVAASGATTSTVSSRYLLGQLETGPEHVAGYDRAMFTLWVDADRDGCDTRDEVLIAEALVKPRVGSGCVLRGGQWRSRYDGATTSDPSSFDVDHMVPLNEAWQSGAWRWSSATRKAFANDLGYRASLIAVTAHSNRSKGDLEPQAWMPERTGFDCAYVKRWVAVKWRWHLKVNAAERSYLAGELRSCGWPRVARPSRPSITTGVTSPTSGDTSTGGSSTVRYAVHPGAYCAEHWQYGRTTAGTLMRCTTTPTDSRFRWRSA